MNARRIPVLVVVASIVAGAFGVAHANTTVLVGPGALSGWEIGNHDGETGTDSPDPTHAGTTGRFGSGPGGPPSGVGSYHQFVGDSETDEQSLRTRAVNGYALAQISQLKYSTYVHRNTDGSQATYLSLIVDLNGNGIYDAASDDTLVFEPVYQSGKYSGDPIPSQCGANDICVLSDTWQTWDARSGGWWSVKSGTPGPPLVTLAHYAQLHPGAKLVADVTTPAVLLSAGGGGSWRNFDGDADALMVNGTTYDFEVVPMPPIITAPSEGRAFPITSIGVYGSAEPNVAIAVYEGSTALSTIVAAADGTWATGQLNFSEGAHTIRAIATTGGVSSPASDPVTFAIDTHAPAAPIITSPLRDSANRASVTVRGTSEPNATIDLREHNAVINETTAGADGSWVFLAHPFANGTHVITATARDAAANTSVASDPQGFAVDAFAPLVAISAPGEQQIVLPGETLEISGEATDNVGVAGVHLDYFDITGRLAASEDATECAGCGTASATWKDHPALVLPGYYTVRVTALDRVGNVSDPVGRAFISLAL